jgi:hypothetical protein
MALILGSIEVIETTPLAAVGGRSLFAMTAV